MNGVRKTPRQLAAENDELRARLEEAEGTLRAMGSGELDAIVVSGAGGQKVYSLEGADHAYRMLVEEMSDGILIMAADGMILSANRRFAAIAKAPSEQVVGSAAGRWLAPDVQTALKSLPGKNASDSYHGESVLTAGDGTTVPIRIAANRLAKADMPDCIGLVVSDLTESHQRRRAEAEKLAVQARMEGQIVADAASRRQLLSLIEDEKRVADALRVSGQRTRLLFESSRDALVTLAPPAWKFTTANAAALEMFGASSVAEFTALGLWDVSPALQPDGRPSSEKAEATIATAMREGSAFFEWEHQRLDGALFFADVLLTRMELDDEVFVQGTVRDITERRKLDAHLAHALSHDVLTGLPHQFAIEGSLMAQLGEGSKPLWVFVIGLDHFQFLNDSLGHVIGDDLLRRAARRLADALGDAGQLARFEGDQFMAAVGDLDHAAALALAERLRAAVALPMDDGGLYHVLLTASVGISHSPDHGRTVQELLRRAQAAMTQAKRQGRDCTREFAVEQMLEIEDRLQLGSQLRGAVERGELELKYQPRVAAGTHSLSGFEALLRWNSQAFGLVLPQRFIPVAEALGVMPEIGDWVLDEACRQARLWIDRGHCDFSIAVNVAAAQLQRPGLVAQVRAALQRHALSPETLDIELTESALMENVARVRDMLGELKALGIQLSLDDFGTGYSSLAYLKQFPIDKLKIDKRFVRGLPDDDDDAAIARTIVAMSHQLRMVVSAEGVETQAQADFLKGIGCDELQGYLLGPPVQADEAEKFFRAGFAGSG